MDRFLEYLKTIADYELHVLKTRGIIGRWLVMFGIELSIVLATLPPEMLAKAEWKTPVEVRPPPLRFVRAAPRPNRPRKGPRSMSPCSLM